MSSDEPVIQQSDVEKVAEIAVEPSWVSEIARKLAVVDPGFSDMGENRRIRIVSRAVKALSKNNKVIIENPEYGRFGGQAESSEHTSLAGEGFAPSNEWNPYTIVHNQGTSLMEVRPSYRSQVDPTISLMEKIGKASLVSEVGNQVAMQVEDILADQVVGQVEDADVIERSDYNDPGVDMYVQGFTAPNGTQVDRGLALEISTRWVNPIGGPYVTSKVNKVMDLEQKHGVPVDLVIMAPAFTRGMLDKYDGADVVQLFQLPKDTRGNPVIVPGESVSDDPTEPVGEFGPSYPVVTTDRGRFITELDNAKRDYVVVDESMYRRQITDIINEVA